MNRSQMMSVAAILACAGTATAQCINPIRLVHQDRVASDFLGAAIAADVSGSGTPIVIAGLGSDDTPGGVNAGSVRVFLRSGGLWGHQEISDMFAEDPQANDFFGTSVAYDAPRIVIGATGVGDHGAAYFFQHDGSVFWQRTKVLPPIAQSGQDFGRCVAVAGDWALVTAPLFDSDGSDTPGFQNPNSGAVFFYKRNGDGTWSYVQGKTFDNLFSMFDGQQMGQSAAMHGDIAVVGAPNAERINWPANHGYIQVYQRSGNTWNALDLGGTFWAPGSVAENDHFGSSVSVDGDWIAVGAPDDDSTAVETPDQGARTNSGCVYIYRKQGGQWSLWDKVFADDAQDSARFGSDVIIREGKLFVVAGGLKKVYFFEDNGVGSFVQKKVYGDPDGTHDFGSGIAFDGETLSIGDENDSVGASNGGALYVIEPEARGSDACYLATEVYAFPQYGCTTHATLNGSTSCGNGAAQGPDVYYKWTARCSGNVIFDTFGSGYDTILSVHDSCPTPGDSGAIVCNDDGFPNINGNRDSLVQFNAVAGTTYTIRISGWSGAKGDYILRHWSLSPSNNACASATVVTNGSHDYFTCNATLDGSPTIQTPGSVPVGADVWFRYTATCTGTLAVNTCGSSFDTVLAVYAGNCPAVNAAPLAGSDDTGSGSICGSSLQSAVTVPVVAGQVYTIRVAGYEYSNASGVQTGQGTLTIACIAQGCNAADVATSGSVDPQAGPDGFLTGDDFDLFVNAFFTELRRDSDNGLIADITDGSGLGGPDGFLTGNDFDKFIQLFFAGC